MQPSHFAVPSPIFHPVDYLQRPPPLTSPQGTPVLQYQSYGTSPPAVSQFPPRPATVSTPKSSFVHAPSAPRPAQNPPALRSSQKAHPKAAVPAAPRLRVEAGNLARATPSNRGSAPSSPAETPAEESGTPIVSAPTTTTVQWSPASQKDLEDLHKTIGLSSPPQKTPPTSGRELGSALDNGKNADTEKGAADGEHTAESLSSMSEADRIALVLRMQTDLLNAQKGHQDVLNRAAMLSSQNESMEAQLSRTEAREQELMKEKEVLSSTERSLRSELQASKLVQQRAEEATASERQEREAKERTIQTMAEQLKQAEQALSLAAASPKPPAAVPQVEAAEVAPSQVTKGAVEELLRRLRTKDREMGVLQAELEALRGQSEGSGSELRVSESNTSGGEGDAETQKLRERVRIVEEVLKAMRDEAREHVLSIQPSDMTLDALLGSGSFAEVHSAHWHLPCAVKRLKDSVRGNRYEVNKFQREAYLLRSLLHPGVLRVFAFSKADFLLVTEVVTGGSLHDVIHATPPVPLTARQVLEYTAQVADVLRYLHLCNVVHRDIKPENLLVDSKGCLKLADFGLACEKKGHYVQSRSNLAGTPRYMAPESYRDDKCTERIDIYSLAMMMWEMITGQLPWEGSNFQDVRHAVATAGTRPAIPADTPSSLAELVTACWDPEPMRRPSAAELLQRIEKLGVKSKFMEVREQRRREEKERREARAAVAAEKSSEFPRGGSAARSKPPHGTDSGSTGAPGGLWPEQSSESLLEPELEREQVTTATC